MYIIICFESFLENYIFQIPIVDDVDVQFFVFNHRYYTKKYKIYCRKTFSLISENNLSKKKKKRIYLKLTLSSESSSEPQIHIDRI